MAQKVPDISKAIQSLKSLTTVSDLSKYGKDFQIKLAALLIKDRIFSFSIIPIIKNEYFTDPYLRMVFVIIRSYVEKYHSLPTIDNIKIELENNNENSKLYDSVLKSIETAKLEDRDFVIDNARKFCFSKHALAENEKVRAALEKGEFTEAQAISTDSFRFSGLNQTKFFNLKKDYDRIYDDEKEHNPIPMPFPTFNANMKGGPGKGNLVIMVAPSNFGKSFSLNTEVFMADMSVKMIQDIKIGDKVMGWDGKPRTVKSVHNGIDEMYRVDQNNGNSYTVNSHHELCIINSKDEVITENIQLMTPVQYIERMCSPIKPTNIKNKWNAEWRKLNCGFKSPGIEFEEKELPFDPYILGLWLGDGDKAAPMVCGIDQEVGDYIKEHQKKNNQSITVSKYDGESVDRWVLNGSNGVNNFRDFLKEYNLFNNKHIPEIFLKNSRENRLKLLAGLIDTDGGLGTLKTSVEITQKLNVLADDIAFLCRSLGLKISLKKKEGKINGIVKGIYNRIIISGKNLVDVPTRIPRKKFVTLKTKKDELKTKISVTPVGKGEYFGFSIEEEDKMFLLSDFTVVHNSNLLIAFSRHANSIGKTVVFFSFEIGGIDMLRRHIAGLTDLKQEDVKRHKDFIEARMKLPGLGDFILIEERATSARISTMKNHIEYLKSTGVFPDMIMVDALNQLKLPLGMKYENDNLKFEYLCEELRDWSNDEELPLYTVFQTNRCLDSFSKVNIENKGEIFIKDVEVGNNVLTAEGYKKILNKYENNSVVYKIKTKKGKEIICSGNHEFPTENGLKSINNGLIPSFKLYCKK